MRRALEFQTRLLKELAVTSDQVLTWRDQIKNILQESAAIVPLYFAYTAYPVKSGNFNLDFFWLHTPDETIREAVEERVQSILAGDPAISKASILHASHTSILETPLAAPDPDTLDLSSKTFFVESMKEGGVAGIGKHTKQGKDLTDLILIESILTAFTNVVSSAVAFTVFSQEIERFATRDPLTGLYNQIAFWDLLEYETERSKRQEYKFSLLVIDIDNFKAINDIYGHEVGDAFLKDFAAIMKGAVRRGDIPARYEGDNFTAILPLCDEEQAFTVAQRIKENLAQFSLVLPDGRQVKETASIGIAVFPDHANDAKDLFLLADNMLYQAKSTGKDRLNFPSDHDSVDLLRSVGEKNIFIMAAVEQHQIIPYFQPIVHAKDRRVMAYEVLTRIVTKDRVVPACEFIETAERMGIIDKIDYQLIEATFKKVHDINYDGTLFMNLSPKVLILSDFMPTVRRLMKEYTMTPERMVFEITERDTVRNPRLTEKFIQELKREGFRFAIDDFGTGFSSFRHIKTFSIDYLKVDGEFIRNMKNNGGVEKAVVESIAALSRSLGIKTIAEFVETDAILKEVEAANLDYAQGYFIQRPSPDLL